MSVTLELKGDATSVDHALEQTKEKLKEVKEVAKEGFNFGEALGMGAAVEGVNRLMEHYVRLEQVATRFHASVEAVQKVNFIGEQNDVNIEVIAKAMTHFQVALDEASKGSDEAKEKLDALGLSAKEFRDLDFDAKIFRLSDAYREAQDTGTGLAELNAVLGKGGAEMTSLLQQGGDALREMAAHAGVLGEEEVKNISEFNKALKELKDTLMSFGGQALGPLLGFMKQMGAYSAITWASMKAFFVPANEQEAAHPMEAMMNAVMAGAAAYKEILDDADKAKKAEEKRLEKGRQMADILEEESEYYKKMEEIDKLRAELGKEIAKTQYDQLDTQGKYLSKIQDIAAIEKQIEDIIDKGSTENDPRVIKLRILEEPLQRDIAKLGEALEKEASKAMVAAMKDADSQMKDEVKTLEDIIKSNQPKLDEFEKSGFGYAHVNYSAGDRLEGLQANVDAIKSTLEASQRIQTGILHKDENIQTQGGANP